MKVLHMWNAVFVINEIKPRAPPKHAEGSIELICHSLDKRAIKTREIISFKCLTMPY